MRRAQRYPKRRSPDKKFLVKADVFCDFCGMENPNIDIDYVAKLARIELTPAEKETYSRQLGQILEYFQKLSEIDVSGVEPSAHAHAMYNVMRDDVPMPAMPVQEALMNAPAARDNQICVPKVVDDA